MKKFIALNESIVSVFGVYPNAKVISICANTSMLSQGEAKAYLKNLSKQTAIPVTDPVRFGVHEILKVLLKD